LQFEGSGRYSPALQGAPGAGTSGTGVVTPAVVEGG